MNSNMHNINIMISEQQLRAEMIHLGPAFNPENYIYIKSRQINEAGVVATIAMIMSIPQVIKLFRYCIDKGQEYWLDKILGSSKKISKAKFGDLFDEDGMHDYPVGLTGEEGALYTAAYKVIKIVLGFTEKKFEGLNDIVAINNKENSRSKEKEKDYKKKKESSKAEISSRKERLEAAGVHKGMKKLMMLSEILGVIQHGLHHVYDEIFNIIGKAFGNVGLFLIRKFDVKSQTKNKIADLLGNVFFVGVILYALLGHGFHGDSGDIMSCVKCVEIIAEIIEMLSIATAIAVASPKALKAIKAAIELFKKYKEKAIKLFESLVKGTKSGVKSFLNLFKTKAEQNTNESFRRHNLLKSYIRQNLINYNTFC